MVFDKIKAFLTGHPKISKFLIYPTMVLGLTTGVYTIGAYNPLKPLFEQKHGHVEHNGRTIDADYEKEVEGDRLFEARLEKDCCGGLLIKLYTEGESALYHTRVHKGLETTLSDVLSTVEQNKLETVMYECLNEDVKKDLVPISKENGEPLGFLRTYIQNNNEVKTELYLVVGVKNATDPTSTDCKPIKDYEVVKLDIKIMNDTKELHTRKVSDKLRVSD